MSYSKDTPSIAIKSPEIHSKPWYQTKFTSWSSREGEQYHREYGWESKNSQHIIKPADSETRPNFFVQNSQPTVNQIEQREERRNTAEDAEKSRIHKIPKVKPENENMPNPLCLKFPVHGQQRSQTKFAMFQIFTTKSWDQTSFSVKNSPKRKSKTRPVTFALSGKITSGWWNQTKSTMSKIHRIRWTQTLFTISLAYCVIGRKPLQLYCAELTFRKKTITRSSKKQCVFVAVYSSPILVQVHAWNGSEFPSPDNRSDNHLIRLVSAMPMLYLLHHRQLQHYAVHR